MDSSTHYSAFQTVGLHCQTPTLTYACHAERQFVPFLWWSLVWPGREANSRPTVREADTLTTKPTVSLHEQNNMQAYVFIENIILEIVI